MKAGIRLKLMASLGGIIALPILLFALGGIESPGNSSVPKGMIKNEVAFITIFLVTAFLLCAIILAKLISSNILRPLKELNAATENIMKGNLDFEIKYKNNDEMGRFIIAFETMRVKLKESLEKQAADDILRKELIASISHDLRTPMSSIKGYVEGLQDGIVHDKEKHDRYIAVIKDKTEKLNRLINDLLQFSQLELGYLEIQPSVHKLDDMLEKLLQPIELEFTDSAACLVVKRPFPSVWINADTHRIAQVFDNLISNAKRYVGENGIIAIEAALEKDFVKITVKDNGTGIDQRDLPHVFQHFYRGEKSRSRHYGGTGLGLAICKQIIENHGGRIWVESTPRLETVFYFTLPVTPQV